jgi:hypothetical protein
LSPELWGTHEKFANKLDITNNQCCILHSDRVRLDGESDRSTAI